MRATTVTVMCAPWRTSGRIRLHRLSPVRGLSAESHATLGLLDENEQSDVENVAAIRDANRETLEWVTGTSQQAPEVSSTSAPVMPPAGMRPGRPKYQVRNLGSGLPNLTSVRPALGRAIVGP